MTKKKSLLLQSLALIGILILTGCGGDDASNEDCETSSIVREDVPFDGDAYFVTSNYVNITNQEVLDEMIAFEESIYSLLDLVDDIVLRASFCVDDGDVDAFMTSLKDDVEDFDAWMVEQGITSEDEIIQIIERNFLREESTRSTVVVTDEEVQEAFEMWFADDEDAEIDEMRQDIYDSLVAQQMGDMENVLAELRYEAGFVIYNEALANAYEQYLFTSFIDIDIHDASDGEGDQIIARVGDDEITVGQLFARLTSNMGMLTAFELIDPMILEDRFEVDPAEVEEAIDELREIFDDEFDMIIAEQGLESEEELVKYLEIIMLQEVAFNETFAPTEERLREMHAQMNETVSGSHILIGNEEMATPEEIAENEALAAQLIERLQNSDDFPELFAELATEYSSCESRESGGDLGSWERGRMVAEFEDAIFAMEVGDFSTEPVETQFGFHIIYKTGIEDTPDFEDVRDELADAELAMLYQTGAMATLLMDLRQEADIVFSNSVLQAQFEAMSSN